LKGEFYFTANASTVKLIEPIKPTQISAPADGNAEIVFWNSVKDSNSLSELQAYLTRYPKGMFAELATSRIERISNQKTQAVANTSPDGDKKPNQPDAGLLMFKNFLDQMMKDK